MPHHASRPRTVSRHDLLRTVAALLMTGLAISPSAAAEPEQQKRQRVFVCAHSFMTFIAELLPPMAAAAGLEYVSAGSQMIGGSQVVEHWHLPDDQVKPALRAGVVDTLILSPTVNLPDLGIDAFTRLGLTANPRLRVLVQASWPAFDDPGSQSIAEFQQWAASFRHATRDLATAPTLQRMHQSQNAGWFAVLSLQIQALNASCGRDVVRIVPVHEAVFAARMRIANGSLPGLTRQTDLFTDDIGHPSPPLTVLVAYCHFAALFARNPVGLPIPKVIRHLPQAGALNRELQAIAWAAWDQR